MSNAAYKKWYEANIDRARLLKRQSMRRLRAENPEKYNAQSKAAKAKERERLFEIYGHECVRCGFSDKRALTLDHIHNNGNTERAELGERGVYRKAKAFHQPDMYQILCMNCQFIKRTEDRTSNQHRTQSGSSSMALTEPAITNNQPCNAGLFYARRNHGL